LKGGGGRHAGRGETFEGAQKPNCIKEEERESFVRAKSKVIGVRGRRKKLREPTEKAPTGGGAGSLDRGRTWTRSTTAGGSRP